MENIIIVLIVLYLLILFLLILMIYKLSKNLNSLKFEKIDIEWDNMELKKRVKKEQTLKSNARIRAKKRTEEKRKLIKLLKKV